MKRIFTDAEQERMIIFTAKIYYEFMKEDPRFKIDNIPEIDVKKVIKEWLSAMSDSDLQVQFGKACVMELEKTIDQAVKEDY
ncbi:MAG: hypothetical protein J1E01_05175 [Acetatifactor sp.]|nr:hypothetical protein [Acetatifactor sp.]